jgi:hypothetical protein
MAVSEQMDLTEYDALIKRNVIRWGKVPHNEREDLKQECYLSLLKKFPDGVLDEEKVSSVCREVIDFQNKEYTRFVKGGEHTVEVEFPVMENFIARLGTEKQYVVRNLMANEPLKLVARKLGRTQAEVKLLRDHAYMEIKTMLKEAVD